MTSATAELGRSVTEWIANLVGGGAVEAVALDHHRPLWSVDVVGRHGCSKLFLRGARDAGSVLASEYNLAREAKVLEALARVGIPAPRVLGYDSGEDLLVLEWLEGRGDFHNLRDQDHRDRIANRFVEVLAALHAPEPAEFGLAAVMAVPLTPEDHALDELKTAERLLAGMSLRSEPLLSFGRRWLRRHVPTPVEHTCFIQGDTGPGNFVFDDRDVWLVDFELAHFGDPMEDLAAVCIRDMVTPFADLGGLFARYDELTSWPLDLDRVRYHRVSKCVRSLIAIVSLAEHGRQRADTLIWWAYRALYLRSACQALAEAMDIDFDALRDPAVTATPRSTTDWTTLHELLSSDLEELAVTTDGMPLGSTVQRDRTVAAVLANVNALGPAFGAAEKVELEVLAGHDVSDNESGLRELDDAIATDGRRGDDIDLLRFLTQRADRQCLLLRPAMGAMADGHFSPIG